MVWLYRDSMCHKIWGLICIQGYIFWMWVPWILNKCSLCNPQHRIHFYLQKAVASHLQPRKQLLPIPVRGSWLWLALFLILLLLCWVHLESSLFRLIVCSSVIAQYPSILRMYSQFYVFFPISGSLSCYHMVTLIFLWSLTSSEWEFICSPSSQYSVSLFLAFSVVYIGILCGFVLCFYDY